MCVTFPIPKKLDAASRFPKGGICVIGGSGLPPLEVHLRTEIAGKNGGGQTIGLGCRCISACTNMPQHPGR